VLPRGASSKEKAILAIHPRSSEPGILAFSRNLKSTKPFALFLHGKGLFYLGQ
jgi:hypothetical protein